jgi:hypothetical protein
MAFWQVRAEIYGHGESVFGVEADSREAALAEALRRTSEIVVPVDLEITEIPPPSARPADGVIL